MSPSDYRWLFEMYGPRYAEAVEGFVALAERLPPEDVEELARVLAAVFDAAGEIVIVSAEDIVRASAILDSVWPPR